MKIVYKHALLNKVVDDGNTINSKNRISKEFIHHLSNVRKSIPEEVTRNLNGENKLHKKYNYKWIMEKLLLKQISDTQITKIIKTLNNKISCGLDI